jgi:hypothetical protein
MLACRTRRAVSARFGLVASLSLAATGAMAQNHYDFRGTLVPAFVLLDGCLSEGQCAGPNSASNPLFVNPAQASTVGDGVVTGGASTASVASGGTSGFAVNDTITLADGCATHTVLKVATVSSGQVASVTIQTAGVCAAAPANPVSQASTSGVGVGTPTFTMTYAPIAQTLFGGVPPVNGWKINNPNASGDFWVSDNGVTPSANGPSSYRVPSGGGGQFATEPGEKPVGSALQLLGATIGAPFIARRW